MEGSATPVIERLGLAGELDTRGANHNTIDMWTPYSGWIESPADEPYGYSVTRQTLDPLLRQLAADTPGVELITGSRAVGLSATDGRPTDLVRRRWTRRPFAAATTGRSSRATRCGPATPPPPR